MSILPQPFRNIYYKAKSKGRIGRALGYAGSYIFIAGVKIFNIKPWKDLAALTIVSHKYKFIYIGIPKVATRSFRDILVTQNKKEFDIESTEKPFAFLRYKEKYPDYFTFGITRNPLDRAVSCYNSKIENASIGKQARIMSLYKSLSPNMSLDDFALWLNSEEGRDDIADRHWISQYLFFEDAEGKPLHDFIGRYETLEEDWKFICKKIGIQHIPLPQKGWNSQEKSEKKMHSDAFSKLIHKRYAQDFKKFNYDV